MAREFLMTLQETRYHQRGDLDISGGRVVGHPIAAVGAVANTERYATISKCYR